MIGQIRDAAGRLGDVCRVTDLIRAVLPGASRPMFLKTENLQYTGSFKLRGAYNAISRLTDEQKSRGLIACSAGNHAQGVALAAQSMGLTATIVMPAGASLSKIDATKSYGAQVILHGDSFDDAYDYAFLLQKERGLTFIHPFDNEDVIAGQGTVGLEILNQMPDVRLIAVPIGGGGLAAGVAAAVKELSPSCHVVGVQSQAVPSMRRAFLTGKIETVPSAPTLADGIAVRRPSEITFELCRRYLDDIVTVTEDEISAAILALLERTKMVAEGAGAAAVAALLFEKVAIPSDRSVAVLSGGNIDVNFLSRIIDSGLKRTGRKMAFATRIADKPGQLSALLSAVANTGANLVSVNHDRVAHNVSLGSCVVELVLETSSTQHIEDIKSRLTDMGYELEIIA